MSDIQKQIGEALRITKGIDTLNSAELTIGQRQAIRDLDIFAYEWLTHQQSIISQQAKEIERLETKYHVDMNNNRSAVQTWQEEHDRQIIKQAKQLKLAVKALEEIESSVECDWEKYANIARDSLSSINSLGGNETP